MQTYQELREGDKENRMEFALTALEYCDSDLLFFHKILFTEESSFSKHHSPNHQNYRMRMQKKPDTMYKGSAPYPEKVNTWAGLVGNCMIGPIFLEGTLTGEKYRGLLQGQISDLLHDLYFDNEL